MDAPTDAPVVVTPPTPAREIIPGGVRMSGATYTADVQLRQPVHPIYRTRGLHQRATMRVKLA